VAERLLREIYETEAMLARIDALLAEARARLAELRQAKEYLESLKPRRAYRIFADLVMVEVPVEEARRIVVEEEELLSMRVRKLEEEREKLARRLEELKRRVVMQT